MPHFIYTIHDSGEDATTLESNESKGKKNYQEVHTSTEQTAKEECSTSGSFELITSLIIRPFYGIPDLSKGSDPQTN
ncbi:uncharacterized protein LOC109815043 isoform X2 [Cajanus cajan]|uniref:uncharacterized protein LOC109815043 isoform X2 n=1 Tax=Cajanus cajan TaxID=3821 RepID=UPI00098D9524|nr:uncharacterized protein LOC109815043 isoform X2 [Cajanus cajan]